MFDGTYEINSFTSKGNPEKNRLVLYTKNGKINGVLEEFAYRAVPFTNGEVNGNKVIFHVEPFITIVDDFSFDMVCELDGDQISGSFALWGAKVPFFGKRVGDPIKFDMAIL